MLHSRTTKCAHQQHTALWPFCRLLRVLCGSVLTLPVVCCCAGWHPSFAFCSQEQSRAGGGGGTLGGASGGAAPGSSNGG